jgi:hypothetical protein
MVGIPLYGPYTIDSSRHRPRISIGLIGTGQTCESAALFLQECCKGVPSDGGDDPFPGNDAKRGYRFDLVMSASMDEKLTLHDISAITAIHNRRARFEACLDMLESKTRTVAERDSPPDCIVVALPDELDKKCSAVDYVGRDGQMVHRDLRDAFKARVMRLAPPTQLLRERTTRAGPPSGDTEYPARRAWNLFTALYFKAGGLPWVPEGLVAGSCYVGISFHRPRGEKSTLRASVVQAFDENGEGLILRGHKFDWDEREKGRSPHLSRGMAESLITMVLRRYLTERKCTPARVVVHKTSRFEAEERDGLLSALKGIAQVDLVAVRPTSDVRLIRTAEYPPLRGTSFSVGSLSYLYTSGYILSQSAFPHGHVPSPLLVADHVGDTPRNAVLRELLILSKVNWNSANFCGLMPITLRFARLVGDVLKEVPDNQVPNPRYAYYM